jgi:LacI family transcriptional regulator
VKRTKKVALMFPIARAGEGQMLRGVTDYALQRGAWTFDMNPEAFDVSIRTLVRWSGDGVLTCLRTEAQVRAAQSLKVPVVNLAGSLPPCGLPRVMVDQEAIGRMAAEHLLDRGLLRAAYFGQQGVWYSQQRERGFVRRMKQAGGECSVLRAPCRFGAIHPWHRWRDRLEQWLKTLRFPVGILSVHDYRARMVLDACLHLKLRVPHDVALVGVDNNEVACEFSSIPLTSVARNSWREGYEAAALLDRLMAGKQPPKHDILIPPDRVVVRRSTDLEAMDDPHVAAATRLIHEHLGEPFGIKNLENRLGVSRRYLYYRFKQCLNCTPHQYISRARIERAKRLLAGPNKLKLHDIAEACGFSDTRCLRQVFQRITGQTLAEYCRSRPPHR